MKTRLLTILVTLLSFSASKAQQTTDEDKIYSFVSMENPPKFPGGIAEFYKFMVKNINYPEEAKQKKIQGNVFVSFIVEKDGSLSNIKVDRKLGYGTDEEAVRVLKLSPNWSPGTQNGKVVRVKYNIPIKFTLDTKETNPTSSKTESAYTNIRLKTYHKIPKDKMALIVIDGKITEIEIDKIDHNSIENIEVFKQDVAKKLYGEKGKNGVIIITTKKTGHTNIDQNDNTVYSFVSMENPPKFPGGIAEFYKFMVKNINYPEEAKQKKIQGNVFVSFTVEKDGSLSNIKVDRKLGYGTDEEAVRVLKLSPNWSPGTQNGKAVRVKYNIPIKFSLNK